MIRATSGVPQEPIKLPLEERKALDQQLADIDDAQARALYTGTLRVIGVRI